MRVLFHIIVLIIRNIIDFLYVQKHQKTFPNSFLLLITITHDKPVFREKKIIETNRALVS